MQTHDSLNICPINANVLYFFPLYLNFYVLSECSLRIGCSDDKLSGMIMMYE